MNQKLPFPTFDKSASLVLLATAVIIILSALGIEHIGGYIPCALCLEQRKPWYGLIVVMGLVLTLNHFKGPGLLIRGLLLLAGLLMLYSTGFGIYHSGVEFGWWQGPADCAATGNSIATDASSFLDQLATTSPPSCSEAALHIFGLSLAAWNAVFSLILAAIAFITFFKRQA